MSFVKVSESLTDGKLGNTKTTNVILALKILNRRISYVHENQLLVTLCLALGYFKQIINNKLYSANNN